MIKREQINDWLEISYLVSSISVKQIFYILLFHLPPVDPSCIIVGKNF